MIANKYIIGDEIKRGAFGKILKGLYKSRLEPVAIKLEYGGINTLKHEVKIMNYLFMNGVRKIPEIYWYGIYLENPCLIISYYECSLFDYMKSRSNISIVKMNILMIKILDIIQQIHKHFVLHRDIKPHNFMVKDGDIVLIDFGLSTFYINENGEHYPDTIGTTLIGTPKFASINIHNGHKYSRRDDLISVGYMYLYMVLGDAPWLICDYVNLHSELLTLDIEHPMNVSLKNNKQYELFSRYMGNNEAIQNYIKYVYSLEYDDLPNYDGVKHLFL